MENNKNEVSKKNQGYELTELVGLRRVDEEISTLEEKTDQEMTDLKVSSFSVSPNRIYLEKGDTYELNITTSPINANVPLFNLEISDINVVRKLYPSNPESLLIYAENPGEVTIKLINSVNPGQNYQISVFVSDYGKSYTEVYYTSSNGNIVTPAVEKPFGDSCRVVENTYTSTGGVMVVSGVPEKIANTAFQNCTTLTGFTLPETITEIGENAFKGCSSLTTITIPEKTTTIKSFAFHDSGLTTFTLPNTVTTVGKGILFGTAMTQAIFNNTIFVCLPSTGVTGEYTVPTGIINVAGGAFHWQQGVTKVILPASVTTMGEQVFYNNTALTELVLNPTTPPAVQEDTLSLSETCQIYVPADSVTTYEGATGWSAFTGRIHAITE